MCLLKFANLRTVINRKSRFNILFSKCIFTRNFTDISSDIPEVSSALIKRVLKSNNIGYEEGYACFMTECVLCKKNAKNPNRTYINKTTGMYMCSNCKTTGDWNEFQLHIDRKKKSKKDRYLDNVIDKRELLAEALRRVQEDSTKLMVSDDLHEILHKFKLPIVSNTSIEKLDIRLNHNNNKLYFPLENAETELVGYRVFTTNAKEEVIPGLEYGGILISRNLKSKDTAILVPNVSDFLVLVNSNLPGNIVCLPNGVHNLSQYILPSLERFKKLILWLGNDMKSWDSARHFSKKLGQKRCQFIRPSEKNNLPHLVKESELKIILNTAQPVVHKSITTFSSLRADVLSDLQNIEKVQGVKWKRFPTLTKILKGHRRGELTVITGPTGSGKTTFISEYSLDLAMQDVNTLWGSFEIRNARLARTMLQQMAGLQLDKNLHLFDHWADEFEKLPIYFMTFHGQQSIKVVMEAVEHATYVHDISHVIIDNVQFMMGMTEEQRHMDRFWKQDAIIAAFRTFATKKNCHVTLVIHPRKEREDEDLTTSSIFGGAKASQEADNVLIIQDKRLTSVRGKKYLQVAKNRYSGDLGIMTLDFDKSSFSFGGKKIRKSEEITETTDTSP